MEIIKRKQGKALWRHWQYPKSGRRGAWRYAVTRTLRIAGGIGVDTEPALPLRYRTAGEAWRAYEMLSGAKHINMSSK